MISRFFTDYRANLKQNVIVRCLRKVQKWAEIRYISNRFPNKYN
jgi:hypothetical protein